MALYYSVGGALVRDYELIERATAVTEVTAGQRGAYSFGRARIVRADAPRAEFVTVSRGGEVGVTRPFTEIGIGRPLTLWITSAYPAQLAARRARGALVSSAVKSWSYGNAKPRALNILKKSAERGKYIGPPAATEEGTSLMFYSPALADRALAVTVEMAFDNVDERIFATIASVFSSAGALPIFGAASSLLLAAGEVIKLAGKFANAIFDGRAEFQGTETLNIGLPEEHLSLAGYALLTRDDLEEDALAEFQIVRGKLVRKSDGALYAGNTPFVVIAADGQADPGLEGFSAMAASAALLERFYNIREDSQTTADVLIQALKLYNDFSYRNDADALAKRLKDGSLPEEERKSLQARYEAIVKNILSDLFKPAASSAPMPAGG